MSRSDSRREFLGTTGTAPLFGLAGCSFGTESSRGTGTKGGQGSGGGATTSATGRTYSFAVTNELESIPEDATPDRAVVTVEAAHPVQGGSDEVIVQREVRLPAGESRTIDDAFTTEPGNAYVVTATLTPFNDNEMDSGHRADTRFEPGGFNAPDTDTFRATVVRDDDVERFKAVIDLDPGED